jgi:hypothetical protein
MHYPNNNVTKYLLGFAPISAMAPKKIGKNLTPAF